MNWEDLSYVKEEDLDDIQSLSFAWDPETHSIKLYPALVKATQILETYDYIGEVDSDSQTLQWPRKSYYEKNNKFVSTATTPNAVKIMCFELALHLISNPILINQATQYRKMGAGPTSLEDPSKPSVFPYVIRDIADHYFYGSSSGELVRSN